MIAPRVTADGRGIRLVMGHRPCRFDIDFATGEILSRPIEHPLAEDGESSELWHPELDAAVAEDEDGQFLCSVEGRTLLRFPSGAEAKCWFDEGRALLVTYPGGHPHRLQIEVWRCTAN